MNIVKAGDILKIKTGKFDANHADIDGKYTFFTCADIPSKANTYSFDDEVLILPGNGANVGRVYHYQGKLEAYQRTYILHEIEAYPKFLYYYFSKYWVRQITKRQVGSATNYIKMDDIVSFKIPLPPLKTQQRIAEILDNAAALRDKTAQLLIEYNLLAQSIFLEMFGDPVLNPKGWNSQKLNDLCGVGSSRRVFVDELVESGIPFYRGKEIGALSSGESINPDLFITQRHYDSLAEATGVPQIGDLLMPSICPDGRIYRVVNNNPFYFKDGRVLWLKVNQSKINSYYLIFFLRELFRTSYHNIASGTTFAELKIVALKKIKALVPPIKLQNQFAEKIALIEQQKALAKQELQQAEDLFNCLLQKAFKGEL